MTLFNILNNCLKLRINTWVEQVRMVNTCYRTVGWNRNNTNVVCFAELFFLRLSCTCHTGQLLIHTEEVLISNGSRCLCFFLNRYTFFGFNRLVETVRVTAAFHCPTSKLIDNQNFLIFTDHIVNVKEHDVVSSQSIVDKVSQGNIFNIVEIVQLEVAFCLVNTWVRQTNRLRLNIDDVVVLIQRFDIVVSHMIKLVGIWRNRSWYNQWCPSFVNQDWVHLIDQGIVEWALYHVFSTDYHVITQVVKADFSIGWIGNVASVRFFLLRWRLSRQIDTDRKAQPRVEFTHFGRVTLSQVFIDCDNVHTFACKGV